MALMAEEAIRAFCTQEMLERNAIYRGQADLSWGLIPSLFRDDRGEILPTYQREGALNAFRTEALPKFRAVFALRLPGVFVEQDFFFWSALAQHMGVKSPLLDWTRNPLVALYMVYSTDWHAEIGCIYAFDPQNCPDRLEIGDWPQLGAFRRIVHQTGLFSYFVSPAASDTFGSDVLGFYEDCSEFLQRIEIDCSKEQCRIGLDLLRFLGIKEELLFPEDLDRAARLLN